MSSIYTNTQANNIYNTYSRNTRASNNFMQRLSTGLKVMTPKDNASVYAISERMRSQIRANEQANQNAQNDSALLKTAQGGISNTVDILKTLKERAINAANDSNLNQNRGDIATEVEQLGLQVDDNAYKVKYNNRAILNGGYDNTIGKLGGSTDKTASATTSENPTARSTNAIYTFNNLNEYSSGAVQSVDSANDKLVGLVKSNATSAGDTLFRKGDKITFSWKEDGNLVTSTLDVDETTTLANMATALTKSNLKTAWTAANANITATDTKTVLDTSYNQAKASSAGLYMTGNQNVSITDFSVSVTYTDKNGTTHNRVEAQETLKASGIQQAYTDETGSNSVWSTDLQIGEAAKGLEGGDNSTKLVDLAKRGGAAGSAWSTAADVANVTFTINGTEVSVAGSSTIDELNAALKDKGIDVQAVLLNEGDAVTYNGATVTNGTGENSATLKATQSGLYFVGGDGYDIKSLSIAATKSDGTTAVNAASDSGLDSLSKVQTRADDPTGNAGPSQALTFFIGGEPNFGMEVTINKMDMKSLLGMTASSFAEKFLTREGAESALTMIDNALSRALNEQTKLGAIESRLGYASDNLTTMNTNMEESDSVLRDADIAKDMVAYAKYSVLQDIAQAMLAQANQRNSSIGDAVTRM